MDVELIGKEIDQKFSLFCKGCTRDNWVCSEVVYKGRDLDDENGDIEGEEFRFDKGSFKETEDGRWDEERTRGGGRKEEVEEEETEDGRWDEERARGGGRKEEEVEVEETDEEEGEGKEFE